MNDKCWNGCSESAATRIMEALCQMEPGSSDKSNESQVSLEAENKRSGGTSRIKLKKEQTRVDIYTYSMMHAFYFQAVHRAFLPAIICAVALPSLGAHPLYISVPVHNGSRAIE